MKFALCNEVLREMSLPEQCRTVAALGYVGLELAPFTLADDPTRMSDRAIAEVRSVVEDHGLVVTGLHWLMIAPEGLSLTSQDTDVQQKTGAALTAFVDLCAGLGGRVLVHGSPAQRRIGDDPERARAIAMEHLAKAGVAARAAGVTYCFEPVAAEECDFVNLVAEAAEIVREIDDPGLRTMIDTCHAARGESLSLGDLADHWLPSGLISHIQLNDANRRAPGQGDLRFDAFFDALLAHGWTHPLAVEPFIYEPDGPTTAARAIGYLQAVAEAAVGRQQS